MSDKPKSLDEIDSFWNFESFIPNRRSTVNKNRSVNVDTVELDLGARSEPKKSGGLELTDWRKSVVGSSEVSTSQSAKGDPEPTQTINGVPVTGEPLVYTPENPLIKSVTICRVKYPISFYRNFKRDANRLWSKTSQKCERVPFFAYVPQHSQLDFDQLRWYLYWRSRVMDGEFLQTDYSYILLFIYEIINCPELIEPSRGAYLLASLWAEFASEYPKLDQVLGNWLCDYCLLHQLPCPRERLGPYVIENGVKRVKLPEFYMGMQSPLECSAELIARSATYDWKKSGYRHPENSEAFDKHIVAAFCKVYSEHLINDMSLSSCEREMSWLSYNDALCEPDTRRFLAVKYISYDRPKSRDNIVNEIIRYSENQVRAGLGVSQRLKINSIPESIKLCIDEYFNENFPSMAKKRKAATKKRTEAQLEAEHRYDSLYEPKSSGFSLENALEIERSSWETTEVLTSALEDSPIETVSLEKAPEASCSEVFEPVCKPIAAGDELLSTEFNMNSGENEYKLLVSSLDPDCRELLKMLADGDHRAAVKLASRTNALADALIDKINETAFRETGDSIIEPCGDGYKIISDYMEELLPWLK